MKNQSIKKRVARIREAAAGPTITDLVRARQEAGFSRNVMARRAGVSLATLQKYEHGIEVRVLIAKRIRETYSQIVEAPDLQAFDGSGKLDAAWLKKQTENFLRSNCLGVVEKEKIAHFVLSSDRVYEYGRVLLLAAGKNIE